MADSSPLQSTDEHQLLRAALESPFQPVDVPLQPAVLPAPTASSPPTSSNPVPADSTSSASSSDPPQSAEEDPWKAEYEAQVEVWRAQSAEARANAERERAKWEAVRLREADERKALGQESEAWDSLGSHITASFAAASEALSGSVASLGSASLADSRDFGSEEQHGEGSHAYGGDHAEHVKTESVSPSQKWENISSSPTSSYPSMSFPEASAPQSPFSHPVPLPPASAPSQSHQIPPAEPDATTVPPSTLPSIMNDRVAPRTRMSLILSSLAINLLLPFVNGVMLGFGEIFAKNVLVGWIGWKTLSGRTAANVGLRW